MTNSLATDGEQERHALVASARNLQQACEELTETIDEFSESLTQVADGFAEVSVSTDGLVDSTASPQAASQAMSDRGFAPADD